MQPWVQVLFRPRWVYGKGTPKHGKNPLLAPASHGNTIYHLLKEPQFLSRVFLKFLKQKIKRDMYILNGLIP